MYSLEHKKYLKKLKIKNIMIHISQITLLFLIIFIWEYLANKEIINTFIFSSPSKIVKTIINLYERKNLFKHIGITCYETLISFFLGEFIGIGIAIILWWNDFIYKVIEPFLTIINSLPKVALGPIIIIIFGANMNSIIIMALLISVIITILSIYNSFINTDINKIKLMKSFNASKFQILKYVILPSNYNVIISSLKINISMSLIGVIMGEFLVSKSGIGYLIMYGSQVFSLNLVISGIVILLVVSYLMYLAICYIEKILIKN